MTTRLAALVVNYNSGAYAEACVASLVHEWLQSGYERDLLEIVIVDNASPSPQEEHLVRLEQAGHKVVRSTENLGYSGGMNLALAQVDEAAAGPKDLVAILNPDLFFLPGSVKTLVEYIRDHDDVGAVDPRAFIDPLRNLNLPRNLLPTLVDHTRMALAQVSPLMCRQYSRHRHQMARPWWETEGPMEAKMLSGCCMFLRREVVRAMPNLLDPRYPLYYEDTDFARTISGLGLKLIHHGGAHVLHYWSRSAGLTEDPNSEAMRRYAVSQRLYFTKFNGALGAAWARLMNRMTGRFAARTHAGPNESIVDLGEFAGSPVIELPRKSRYLVEMGMAANFLLSGGMYIDSDRVEFPMATWEWLFQAPYFIRVIDRETNAEIGIWCFRKTSPGRNVPMGLDEMIALEEAGV